MSSTKLWFYEVPPVRNTNDIGTVLETSWNKDCQTQYTTKSTLHVENIYFSTFKQIMAKDRKEIQSFLVCDNIA